MSAAAESNITPIKSADFTELSPLLKLLSSGELNASAFEAAAKAQTAHENALARGAYCDAMARVAAEMPTVQRTGRNPHLRNSYASLDDIITTISPVLARHGLHVSWSYEQPEGHVVAHCEITHNAGHSRSNQFSVPVEMGKGTNAAQAHAIASTYARRYSLLGLLGCLASAEDTDAHVAAHAPAAAPPLKLASDDQIQQIIDMLGAVEDAIPGTTERWRKARGIHYPEADNPLGLAIPEQHVNNIIGELAAKLKSAAEKGATEERAIDEVEIV